MSRKTHSQDFTQDPLDVDNVDTANYSSKLDYGTSGKSNTKKEKKAVSIKPAERKFTVQLLKSRNHSVSHNADTELTPLLHPSISLPTVVGYDGYHEDYHPGRSTITTRSEIGRHELSRKKRRSPHYSTLRFSRCKQRPFIISPFMPISTQISVDSPRSTVAYTKGGCETTCEALLEQETEICASESEEESNLSEEEEQELPFLKNALKTVSALSSRQLLTISMLSLANLCSTIAFSCIAPFYPTEAKQKALSETQTGIVFGIFEFTMFIISPLFGKYIIFVGARRMFIVGIAVTGITAILFGFLNYLPSGEIFFWFSVLVRILEAVGDAAFVTSSFAIAAKSFPRNVAFVVGILETFAGLGYTAGPVIGGFFYDIGGFQLPFLVLGIVLLLASILAFFLIESRKDDESNPENRESFNLTPTEIGSVATLLSMIFIGPSPLLDKYVSKDLITIGLSLAVLGLAASALYIPCFQMCLDEVKLKGFEDNFHTYGCVSGIFQAAFGFGSFIGPTFGSVIVEKIGFQWTTTLIAFLHVILSTVVVIKIIANKCKNS
ncbi:unnamed protein product [Caenorhabditis sp. 36 PRJEB53466]|nr:unnamed protein product [Caenorhabditis sp. 36 PRJEB53466]